MNQKEKISREDAVKLFIEALGKCPLPLLQNTGAEGLAEEITKGADKLMEYINTEPHDR